MEGPWLPLRLGSGRFLGIEKRGVARRESRLLSTLRFLVNSPALMVDMTPFDPMVLRLLPKAWFLVDMAAFVVGTRP
ncbi:hypothetical protein GCM10020218_031330 [Dactylosporangium vinaceum]